MSHLRKPHLPISLQGCKPWSLHRLPRIHIPLALTNSPHRRETSNSAQFLIYLESSSETFFCGVRQGKDKNKPRAFIYNNFSRVVFLRWHSKQCVCIPHKKVFPLLNLYAHLNLVCIKTSLWMIYLWKKHEESLPINIKILIGASKME